VRVGLSVDVPSEENVFFVRLRVNDAELSPVKLFDTDLVLDSVASLERLRDRVGFFEYVVCDFVWDASFENDSV
jgi:hypothetical protein